MSRFLEYESMARVQFFNNPNVIPLPWREQVESEIRAVLDALRPTNEIWRVAHSETAERHAWDIELSAQGRTEILNLQSDNAEAQRVGVTTAALQTQAELALRQARLRVLSEDEWKATPGLPMLRVQLTIVRNQTQLAVYAFNLEIEVAQSIVLARDPSVATF